MCNPPSTRPSLSNIPTLKTKQHLAQPPPPQNTVITKTHLKLTTHNIQKRNDTTNAIIAQHFQTHTDILCFQEVLEKAHPSTQPGPHDFLLWRHHQLQRNSIFPSYISPFRKLISHTHSEGTITAIRISLPGYPTFALICLYKTYHAALTRTMERILDSLLNKFPLHIRLGDFNSHTQPHLDTQNIKHIKQWPWLQNQLLPENICDNSLIDLFRKENPETTQFTRYASNRLPNQSRIDLILTSHSFHTSFQPLEPHIHTNNFSSDHHPVSTYITLATNPINIHHTPKPSIRFKPLNQEQRKQFSDHLSPIDAWCEQHSNVPRDTDPDTLSTTLNSLLSSITEAYRSVTHTQHSHKPTSLEKSFTTDINSIDLSKPITTHTTQKLQKKLNTWRDKLNQKRTKYMHHCLIKGYNLKRAISNLTTPQSHTPITLKDDKGNIITDPTLLCQTMGENVATLGGPKDFNIDPNLIDELMANSPSIPADNQSPPFTKDFFYNILASANPTTAPGLDETNFFLFHISPSHIKHFLFSACSYVLHNPIPNQWLRAKVIPFFKKGDPQIPSNYRPLTTYFNIQGSSFLRHSRYYFSHP